MDTILQLLGALVVFMVLLDVFLVVLFPSSGHSLLQATVTRITCTVFRMASRPLQAQNRRNMLAYTGPAIIMLTLTTWLGLLVIGWGMIYYPVLGEAIRASSGLTQISWATAMYFSAFNLTTLGVGDVVAESAPYRLLSVLQAGIGFSFFSMVITYFLAVYPNLVTRNTFAQEIHYLSGCRKDAATLIARQARHDNGQSLVKALASKVGPLCQIHEAHRFYPILRHFHYRKEHYTLPCTLYILLDTVTLVQCALDRKTYRALTDAAAVEDLYQAVMTLIDELTAQDNRSTPSAEAQSRWTDDFRRSWRTLSEAGISLEPDQDRALEDYLTGRARWSEPLKRLENSVP